MYALARRLNNCTELTGFTNYEVIMSSLEIEGRT